MDNKNKPFSFKDRARSFKYAFSGLKTFFETQHNSWIHIGAAIAAIILGFFFDINKYEWCFVITAIGLVLMAEIFNTAIEFLTDKVSPDYSALAKKVKDMAAAAVLIISITALCIGMIIFGPKLMDL